MLIFKEMGVIISEEVIYMADTLIISHRGANKYAPQNTLPAFERSIEIGTDGFETDVHLTKDGKVVLCHNYTIDETSDGEGNVCDKTLEELKSYDFGSYFSPKYKGTTLPTLDEFLALVAKTDIKVLNIEIKSPKQSGTPIVKETIDAAKRFGLFERLLISSFDPKLLVEAKEIDPECKTGFLYAPNHATMYTMGWRPVQFAKSIKADALHPHYSFVNEEYVKKAHDGGLMVNPWTVNNPDIIDKLIRIGCDAIITDLPDVVGGILEKYNF